MSDIYEFSPLWGEWEIEDDLGEGSFGKVWKVRRQVVGGRVYYAAVKHISIPKDKSEIKRLMGEGIFSDEDSAVHYYEHMLQSLANEIDAMHSLRGYTNIVDYEDHKIIPKAGGIGYDLLLRMELLTPLTDRIQKGMSVSDVVSLGKDIATAIAVLNDHHMIHRDIKPQNIFVNDKGIYKLGDYGTARALGTGATAMSRKGTFNYMSPEIYNNQKADIRADIYSLGLVLYRLLNGNRLPFLPVEGPITSEDSDQAVLRRISGEKIPAPKYANKELARIVLKACAFNPNDRYRTPQELVRDLEKYKSRDNELIPNADKKRTDPSAHVFTFGSSESRRGSSSANNAGRDGAQNWASETDDEETVAGESTGEPQKPVNQQSGSRGNVTVMDLPPRRKRWVAPLIAVLAVGLIAGGLFGTGILPPKPPEPTAAPEVTATFTPSPFPEGADIYGVTITSSPVTDLTETPTPTVPETPTPSPTPTPSTPPPTPTPTPTPSTPPPTPTPTPTPVPVMPGDVNGDNEVNSGDVIRLQKYLSQMDVTIDEEAADLTGDGVVDSKDLIRLTKIVNGWD